MGQVTFDGLEIGCNQADYGWGETCLNNKNQTMGSAWCYLLSVPGLQPVPFNRVNAGGESSLGSSASSK